MTDVVLSDHLRPLARLLGRGQTSGHVLDERGVETAVIASTDTCTALPGGHWIAHEVDVRVGGGWSMHAFDAEPGPGIMRLVEHSPGELLVQGDAVRSWLSPHVGAEHMTTRWERLVDDAWQLWVPMRFDRL